MRNRAFGLFALAFSIRVAAAFALPDSHTVLPDSREYLALAEGKKWATQTKRPPLYPLFLAPHRALFPGRLRPIQISQAFLGGLTCVLVFLLGRRLFPGPAGGWAGVACAFYPLLVYTGPAILIEGLHATLLLLEIWFLVHAERRWSWGLAAGGAGGLAVLLHPGHALFFLAVFAYRRGRFLLPYAAMLALGVGLWTWRNHTVLGRFVPLTTQSGYALFEAFGPEATGGTIGHRMAMPARDALDDAEYDALLRREALRDLRPLRVLRLAVEKQRRFWSVVPHAEEYRSAAAHAATLCFAPVLLFFLIALWKGRPGAGWLLLPVLYYASIHAIFIGSIRYRLAVEPFLILVAAWGCLSLISRARRRGPLL